MAKFHQAWQTLRNDPELARAVEKEAEKRTSELLAGAENLNKLAFSRDIDEPPCKFSIGNARLLDYGHPDPSAPAVFLVPSLINRYYIMDLTQNRSFARYLQSNGLRVFVVDWGSPGFHETSFGLQEYITEILLPMAAWVRNHTQGAIIHCGYCMGGMLTLALATIAPQLADKLALLATPWDFEASSLPLPFTTDREIAVLEHYLHTRNHIPPEVIHLLFHYAHPLAFHNKMRDLSSISPTDKSLHDFLAIEHWANDGVAMTNRVARDCLVDLAQMNLPAKDAWKIAAETVLPSKIKLDCFIAAPRNDKIVPSACALPLARQIKRVTLVEPDSGHVGMMAGKHCKSALWLPFMQWVDR